MTSPQPPLWGTAPPENKRVNKLAAALAAAVVVLVAVAVGVIVHHNTPPPPPGSQAAATPSPLFSRLPSPGTNATGLPSALPSPGATAVAPTIILAPTQAPSASPSGSGPASSSASPAASASASASPPPNDPVSVAKAYYGDLAAHRTTDAYNLLCQVTQASFGLQNYTADYDQDVQSGTGIKRFAVGTGTQIQGDEAAVPGTITLDDGETVPITVLLLEEQGEWRVCSSDLGGVLPNPGSGSAGNGTTGGGTTT